MTVLFKKVSTIWVFFLSGPINPFRMRHLDDVVDQDETSQVRQEMEIPLRYKDLVDTERTHTKQIILGGVPVEEIPNILSKEIKLYISSAGTGNKKRNEKCNTVGTFPKFKRKIIEIGKISIPNIPIHDRSFP